MQLIILLILLHGLYDLNEIFYVFIKNINQFFYYQCFFMKRKRCHLNR